MLYIVLLLRTEAWLYICLLCDFRRPTNGVINNRINILWIILRCGISLFHVNMFTLGNGFCEGIVQRRYIHETEAYILQTIFINHYSDVTVNAMTSQIPGVLIVCWAVCLGADQTTHRSSASLAFVRGIHRWPVASPQKRPVTRKMFPFDDAINNIFHCHPLLGICLNNTLETNNDKRETNNNVTQSNISCNNNSMFYQLSVQIILSSFNSEDSQLRHVF